MGIWGYVFGKERGLGRHSQPAVTGGVEELGSAQTDDARATSAPQRVPAKQHPPASNSSRDRQGSRGVKPNPETLAPEGRPASSPYWPAPIVVGKPIASFEPEALTEASMPADIVAGGWSTSRLSVRYSSQRGAMHLFEGEPRQDSVKAAAHAGTQGLAVAVADGVGNAAYSHEGSRVACRVMTHCLLEWLEHGPDSNSWNEILSRTSAAITQLAAKASGEPNVDMRYVESKYATTVTAGLVIPDSSSNSVSTHLVVVGDSYPWLLRGNGDIINLALQSKESSDGVFSSAVEPLPRVPSSPLVVSQRLTSGDVLLIGSDGFGDPLGTGQGAVADHFRSTLQAPGGALEFAYNLAFSRELADDDRSLIAVWPR